MPCTNCSQTEYNGWVQTKSENDARLEVIEIEMAALESEKQQKMGQNSQLHYLITQCQLDGGPPQ